MGRKDSLKRVVFFTFFLVVGCLVIGCSGAPDGEAPGTLLDTPVRDGSCGLQANGEGYGAVSHVVVATNGSKSWDLSQSESGSMGSVRTIKLLRSPCHGRLEGSLAQATAGARMAADSGTTATYVPEKKYEGEDGFEYEFTDTSGKATRVAVYIDVRPCLRNVSGRPNSKNVHVIGVYEAHDSQHGIAIERVAGEVKVHVAKSSEPAVLFLASYEPIHWTVILEPGAQVEHAYVQGYYRDSSTVTGIEASRWSRISENESAYQWEPGSGGDNRFQKFIGHIRDRVGKNEATFQGCYSGVEFRVPYTTLAMRRACEGSYKPSYYSFDNQDCVNKCNESRLIEGATKWAVQTGPGTSTTWGSVSVSADGRSVTGPAGLVQGVAQATLGKSCGRHYFEIDAQRLGGTWWGNSIGFTHWRMPSFQSMTPDPMGGVIYMPGSSAPTSGVIGIAMDLEDARIAYRLNGNWLFGANPGIGSSGTPMGLTTYDPVFPAVSVSETTQLIADFEGVSLRYPVPSGYSAGWK